MLLMVLGHRGKGREIWSWMVLVVVVLDSGMTFVPVCFCSENVMIFQASWLF